jgi:hypothetical protein
MTRADYGGKSERRRGGGAKFHGDKGLGGGDLTSTKSIIHWECKSPEHRALRSRHGNGGLTIHDGAWAYCDGAGSDGAHHWSATGGMPLEALVRWTSPIGATADAPPPTNGSRPQFTVRPANGSAAKAASKTTGVRRT